MSATSPIHEPPHTGFITAMDPASARHQLHMSASVVVVLALAIAASLFAFRPDRSVAIGAIKPITAVASLHGAAGMPVFTSRGG